MNRNTFRLGDIVRHDQLGTWVVTTPLASKPVDLPHGYYRVRKIFHNGTMEISPLDNTAMRYSTATFAPFARVAQLCALHEGMRRGDIIAWNGDPKLFPAFFGKDYWNFQQKNANRDYTACVDMWVRFHQNNHFDVPVKCTVESGEIVTMDEHDSALCALRGNDHFTIQTRAPFEKICGEECDHLYLSIEDMTGLRKDHFLEDFH